MIALGTDDVRDVVVNSGRLINSCLPMVDGAREPEYIDMSIALVALGLRFSMVHTGGGGLAGGVSLTLIKKSLKAIPSGPARGVLARRVRQDLKTQQKVSKELNALFTQLDNNPEIVERLFPKVPSAVWESNSLKQVSFTSDSDIDDLITFALQDDKALLNLHSAVFKPGEATTAAELRQARGVIKSVVRMQNTALVTKLVRSAPLLQGLKVAKQLGFTQTQLIKLGEDFPEFAQYPPEGLFRACLRLDGFVDARYPKQAYVIRFVNGDDIARVVDSLGTLPATYQGPTPWGVLNETVNLLSSEFDHLYSLAKYEVKLLWDGVSTAGSARGLPRIGLIRGELDGDVRRYATFGRAHPGARVSDVAWIFLNQNRYEHFSREVQAETIMHWIEASRKRGEAPSEIARFYVPAEYWGEGPSLLPEAMHSFVRVLPPMD